MCISSKFGNSDTIFQPSRTVSGFNGKGYAMREPFPIFFVVYVLMTSCIGKVNAWFSRAYSSFSTVPWMGFVLTVIFQASLKYWTVNMLYLGYMVYLWYIWDYKIIFLCRAKVIRKEYRMNRKARLNVNNQNIYYFLDPHW